MHRPPHRTVRLVVVQVNTGQIYDLIAEDNTLWTIPQTTAVLAQPHQDGYILTPGWGVTALDTDTAVEDRERATRGMRNDWWWRLLRKIHPKKPR